MTYTRIILLQLLIVFALLLSEDSIALEGTAYQYRGMNTERYLSGAQHRAVGATPPSYQFHSTSPSYHPGSLRSQTNLHYHTGIQDYRKAEYFLNAGKVNYEWGDPEGEDGLGEFEPPAPVGDPAALLLLAIAYMAFIALRKENKTAAL